MGVASEGDDLPAFFAPPANDLRAEMPVSVDLQSPATVSEYPQRVTELFLESVRIELPCLDRPGTDRVVDMGEYGEPGPADQAGYLCQIVPDNVGRRAVQVQVRRLGEPLAERKAVQGAEYPIKLPGAEQFCGRVTSGKVVC
jgi:hypothetical protein